MIEMPQPNGTGADQSWLQRLPGGDELRRVEPEGSWGPDNPAEAEGTEPDLALTAPAWMAAGFSLPGKTMATSFCGIYKPKRRSLQRLHLILYELKPPASLKLAPTLNLGGI